MGLLWHIRNICQKSSWNQTRINDVCMCTWCLIFSTWPLGLGYLYFWSIACLLTQIIVSILLQWRMDIVKSSCWFIVILFIFSFICLFLFELDVFQALCSDILQVIGLLISYICYFFIGFFCFWVYALEIGVYRTCHGIEIYLVLNYSSLRLFSFS